MMLFAMMACGAMHLHLVNKVHPQEKAAQYYELASNALLKVLQNPNRDTVVAATTAVILNVYETMTEKALQRMNHIAGARALIKECGWNAQSLGISGACFWLNVGMEVLSCLHFNWQVTWDPDDWGMDLTLIPETETGREEVWTHRMLYIVAKCGNFRATIPRFQQPTPHAENLRFTNRCQEWNTLKNWTDAWNAGTPRTMHPLAQLYPTDEITKSQEAPGKSSFPEIW